jgi:hypothetical protein
MSWDWPEILKAAWAPVEFELGMALFSHKSEGEKGEIKDLRRKNVDCRRLEGAETVEPRIKDERGFFLFGGTPDRRCD